MTIGEIAEKTGVSVTTLRYYERIGLLPAVPRNSRGIRVYDESFVSWLELIQNLKIAGMQLEEIIEYIELAKLGARSLPARARLLAEARENMQQKLRSLQEAMKKADDVLENFAECWEPLTNELVQNLKIAS